MADFVPPEVRFKVYVSRGYPGASALYSFMVYVALTTGGQEDIWGRAEASRAVELRWEDQGVLAGRPFEVSGTTDQLVSAVATLPKAIQHAIFNLCADHFRTLARRPPRVPDLLYAEWIQVGTITSSRIQYPAL